MWRDQKPSEMGRKCPLKCHWPCPVVPMSRAEWFPLSRSLVCAGPYPDGCPPSCLGWGFSRETALVVLRKAGGQDAVTACSYSCGSQEARSEHPERVEYGAGQTWSLLSPFAGGP